MTRPLASVVAKTTAECEWGGEGREGRGQEREKEMHGTSTMTFRLEQYDFSAFKNWLMI